MNTFHNPLLQILFQMIMVQSKPIDHLASNKIKIAGGWMFVMNHKFFAIVSDHHK